MNKTYKTIWCEATWSWVAVSEHVNGGRVGATATGTNDERPIRAKLREVSLAALAAFGLSFFASPAMSAPTVASADLCSNYQGGHDSFSQGNPVLFPSNGCTNGITSWTGGAGVGSPINWIGLSADDTQIVLNGSTGQISFRVDGALGNVLTMSNVAGVGPVGGVLLSGVAPGAVTATSSEAVNGSQLYSLSTSVSSGITNISTASSAVTAAASSLTSLSTSASTGLSTTNSAVTSLSTSASTGLSTTNSSVTSLSTS
ncbi:ESPR-type extended signal peptide-containing protein, partial [Burkholderia sp. GS2Y]